LWRRKKEQVDVFKYAGIIYSMVETELLGIHRQNFGILTVALCGDRRGYFGWKHWKRFRRPSIVDLHFGDYTGMMGIECLKSLLLSNDFEIKYKLWKEVI
jgi:hypothetical protein